MCSGVGWGTGRVLVVSNGGDRETSCSDRARGVSQTTAILWGQTNTTLVINTNYRSDRLANKVADFPKRNSVNKYICTLL